MKLENWRTKFHNGILQEIYGHLILQNLVKISIYAEGGCEIDISNKIVKKSNFKVILNVAIASLKEIARGNINAIFSNLRYWIIRTIESRSRFSRSYKREVRCSYSRYKTNGSIKRRP